MLFDTAGVGGWEGFSLHGFTLRASPAVTHGVSPLGTVGAYAEEFRPAYRVQSVDNFTHYDRHTESQQSSVSHATAHKSATAPVAEYLTPPAEAHHA